jgi:hypothetical protein
MCLSEQPCVTIEQVKLAVTITTGNPEMSASHALRSPIL